MVKATKGKTPTRANHRETVERQRQAQIVSVWDSIRERVASKDPALADYVDTIADRMTLADMVRLELVEMEKIDALIRHYLSNPKASTLVQGLVSIKLQCRKHIRQLKVLQGPALTANDQPVRLPIGMSEPELLARVAEILDDEIVS